MHKWSSTSRFHKIEQFFAYSVSSGAPLTKTASKCCINCILTQVFQILLVQHLGLRVQFLLKMLNVLHQRHALSFGNIVQKMLNCLYPLYTKDNQKKNVTSCVQLVLFFETFFFLLDDAQKSAGSTLLLSVEGQKSSMFVLSNSMVS